MESKVDPMAETLEKVVVKPKKTNISVSLVALAWAPYWRIATGS